MSRSGRLGLLGGTFDPIHIGHLDAADAAASALGLGYVLFVPAHDPPHRTGTPHASAFHRFAMVALAVNAHPQYRASDLELTRTGPSYTLDTLRALHEDGWQPSQIFFILGADAFAEIATWHAFPSVLDAAHFAVIARPGTSLGAAVTRAPKLPRPVRRADEGPFDGPETHVILIEADTRDVSSTTIRSRLAARQPIDDLVAPAVARHVVAHHLYER